LQSKDRTKVRQPFRAFFGAGADDFTALTPDSPLFYLFFLKNTKEYSKKTDKSLVDFLSVFYGAGYMSRTFSGSNPPTANFFRLLCSVNLK